jgi:hypothetical protein
MGKQHSDEERHERISAVFMKLKEVTEDLKKQTIQASYNQNAIAMGHIFSGAEKQIIFRQAQQKFYKSKFAHSVHMNLMDLFKTGMDQTGHFRNCRELILKLDNMSKEAVEKEEFGIAEIVKAWRNMLPDE